MNTINLRLTRKVLLGLLALLLLALVTLTTGLVRAAASSGYDLSCLHCAAGTRGGAPMAARLPAPAAVTAWAARLVSRMPEYPVVEPTPW